GVLAKIGLDVSLLQQTEVGEASEAAGGGSSAMPQKRNPIGCVRASACARRARACAGVLLESLVQEHERAAGAGHAEGGALSDALAAAGGAAAAMRPVLEGLEVHPARMRANLSAGDGAVFAEQASLLLAQRIGRAAAHELVAVAAQRAQISGRGLQAELADDP